MVKEYGSLEKKLSRRSLRMTSAKLQIEGLQVEQAAVSKIESGYRKITVEDVRDMAKCGLIARYGYYGQDDLQTVRAVLQYEKLLQNRQHREAIRDNDGNIHCRLCGVLLEPHDGKAGRPKEYCQDCEPTRSRERNAKWRLKQTAVRE